MAVRDAGASGGTVLVTGSSSGIGLVTAVRMARAGYDVVATMRNVAAKEQLLRAAEAAGAAARIDVQRLDVTDADSITATMRHIESTYPTLDVLINNAGYAAGGFVEEVPLERWRQQFETNVFGLIAVTQAVVPRMRERRQGCIINISSISGRIGFPAMGPYSASKHAVEGLTEALRLELKPYGIRVVLIEPASYRTEIWQKGLDGVGDLSASAYQDVAAGMVRGVQEIARGGGDPNEIAGLIHRIVTTGSQRFRYPIGRGAKGLDLAKRLLPWAWIERAMARRLAK